MSECKFRQTGGGETDRTCERPILVARVAQLEGALREFLNSKLESTGDVVVAKARLGFALTDREDPNAPETNWNYGDKP